MWLSLSRHVWGAGESTTFLSASAPVDDEHAEVCTVEVESSLVWKKPVGDGPGVFVVVFDM
jgi:hypothetical protein